MISAKSIAVVAMLGVICGVALALLTTNRPAGPPPDRVSQTAGVKASAPERLKYSANTPGELRVAVLDRVPLTFGETEVLKATVVGQIQVVGNWTVWNLDGSIDETRTGFYENGAKIQPIQTSPFAGAILRIQKPVDLSTIKTTNSFFFATRDRQ